MSDVGKQMTSDPKTAGSLGTVRQGARLHGDLALLADVAEEAPARAAPAVHCQAARARHRHVGAVRAQRGMR